MRWRHTHRSTRMCGGCTRRQERNSVDRLQRLLAKALAEGRERVALIRFEERGQVGARRQRRMRRCIFLDEPMLHGQLAHLRQSKLQRATPRLLKGDAHLSSCCAPRLQTENRVLGGACGFEKEPASRMAFYGRQKVSVTTALPSAGSGRPMGACTVPARPPARAAFTGPGGTCLCVFSCCGRRVASRRSRTQRAALLRFFASRYSMLRKRRPNPDDEKLNGRGPQAMPLRRKLRAQYGDTRWRRETASCHLYRRPPARRARAPHARFRAPSEQRAAAALSEHLQRLRRCRPFSSVPELWGCAPRRPRRPA